MEERQKRHGQHIIRTDADKNLIRPDVITRSQRGSQICVLRESGVQPEFLRIQTGYCPRHPGRRRIRAFVGIQFDNARFPRLLAGRVGHHPAHILFPFHVIFPLFSH